MPVTLDVDTQAGECLLVVLGGEDDFMYGLAVYCLLGAIGGGLVAVTGSGCSALTPPS